MSRTDREPEVIAAFMSLATRLTDSFDIVDLLSELTSDCARLLDVASAGLLLADSNGTLHLLAASSEATRDLEILQLQRDQGPCLDCFHSGAPVSVPDLSREIDRWPLFVVAARAAGFSSVHALPMRLNDTVLGALNLFGNSTGSLADGDLALAQALAHVASVALVQEKAAADKDLVVSQLNTAFVARIVIEQAKGVISQVGDLDMDAAFAVLRQYARDHNVKLSQVAASLIARELSAQSLIDYAAARGSGSPAEPRGTVGPG